MQAIVINQIKKFKIVLFRVCLKTFTGGGNIYSEVVPNGLGIGGHANYYCNPHCSYLHLFK